MKDVTSSLVSVIIPIYNAEKYIERCLDSIISQSYNNLEIILVNDGSTDNSYQKIKKFLSDPRVTYIQKENSGPSETRNIGITASKGEFLCFVDADDYVSEDYVFTLMRFFEDSKSQLIVTSYIEYSSYAPSGNRVNQIEKVGTYNKDQFIPYLFKRTMGVLWGKLFRRDIIFDNSLQLKQDVRFQEDLLFIFAYLQHCHSIFCINEYTYNYNRLNENNLTASIEERHLKDFEKVQSELENLTENISLRNLIKIRELPFYQQYIVQSAKKKFSEFDSKISKLDFRRISMSYQGNKKYSLFFLLLRNNAKFAAYCYIKLIDKVNKIKK